MSLSGSRSAGAARATRRRALSVRDRYSGSGAGRTTDARCFASSSVRRCNEGADAPHTSTRDITLGVTFAVNAGRGRRCGCRAARRDAKTSAYRSRMDGAEANAERAERSDCLCNGCCHGLPSGLENSGSVARAADTVKHDGLGWLEQFRRRTCLDSPSARDGNTVRDLRAWTLRTAQRRRRRRRFAAPVSSWECRTARTER
jgi:hypothetical protein